jgi:large subunit ribosomal protein L22
MEVKSTTKYVALSPKKARDVAREIQGLPVSSARPKLNINPNNAPLHKKKKLNAAMADAE